LPEAEVMCERSSGKDLQPVVLPSLQSKGHVRQRSISGDKPFGYLVATK